MSATHCLLIAGRYLSISRAVAAPSTLGNINTRESVNYSFALRGFVKRTVSVLVVVK